MLHLKNIFTEHHVPGIPTAAFLQRTECTGLRASPITNCFAKVASPLTGAVIIASLTVFLFCAACTSTQAQQIRFDRLSIAEGLSSNSVYTVFQDSHGVLWIGTLDGLNRYDGYGITVYKHDHQKKGSISNNRITAIYEDHQHHLWLYDEFTSTIIRYTPAKDEFSTYHLEQAAGAELDVLDFIGERDSTLYVCSQHGNTLRYDAADDSFHLLNSSGPLSEGDHDDTHSALLDAFGQYLKQANSPFTVSTIMIRKVMKDHEGRYWIATRYDGLYTAVEQPHGFEFFSHLRTDDKFKKVTSEEINDVYEDRSNVVWIGTRNKGLYRYAQYKYKFDHIESIETTSGAFQLGTLRAITQDAKGNIWAGTNDQGLVRIDAFGKTGKVYRPEPGKRNSIGHRFIRSLWIDAGQNLWAGHYNGFSRYRAATDDFIPYHPKGEHDEEVRVYDIKGDQQQGLWMAAWDLVMHFDPATNQYAFISQAASLHQGFSIQNIRELELDASGTPWIVVGEKGISIFNKGENMFTTLHSSPENPASLPSNNIFDVFKDSHGNVWLATADGLCHFNVADKSCETYTVNNGLPSNLVYGVMEDSHGQLWFSSTKGIGKFDPLQKRFRNYDVSDGLQSNEFTENAFYQNSDGLMFFGGINGLNIFHPDRVPDNPNPPQVSITGVKAFDNPLSEVRSFGLEEIRQKMQAHDAITFTPGQRSISFEFVALHYVNPQKNRYAYMLEGFDKQWTYRDANVRFANYTNLEPATYYFKVRASNSDGVWSDAITLKIIVEKPFYATWWFITLCTLALLTLGVFAYRWRIAVVKKQQSMKSIQLESELNFLKSQVNPHFLFNTLNNIYALCQVNSRNAAPMVGKVSDMMRYMIYDCNADLVPLQKEIEYLQNYIDLHQLKSHRKLNAVMVVHGDANGLKIAPLLLINFLENCFKHGDLNVNAQGFIHAELIISRTVLLLTMKNSFREKKSAGPDRQGIGLGNVKHRLTLLYPAKHSLRIGKNNGIFEVELKMHLD